MTYIKTALTSLALVTALGVSTMTPAKADGAASTRNIIFGAAAAIAGFAIENNVAQKNRTANTIEGYTQDGSTVYADGHVLGRDGRSYYPGNDGGTLSCDGQYCQISYNGNGNFDGYAGNRGFYANGPGYGNGFWRNHR